MSKLSLFSSLLEVKPREILPFYWVAEFYFWMEKVPLKRCYQKVQIKLHWDPWNISAPPLILSHLQVTHEDGKMVTSLVGRKEHHRMFEVKILNCIACQISRKFRRTMLELLLCFFFTGS